MKILALCTWVWGTMLRVEQMNSLEGVEAVRSK